MAPAKYEFLSSGQVVGLDVGISTVAIAGDDAVGLEKLFPVLRNLVPLDTYSAFQAKNVIENQHKPSLFEKSWATTGGGRLCVFARIRLLLVVALGQLSCMIWAMRNATWMIQSLIRKAIFRALRVAANVRPATDCALRSGGVLLTCHHLSLVDGALVALASPVPLLFLCDPAHVNRRCSRWGIALLRFVTASKVLPLSGQKPMAMRSAVAALLANQNVVMFPADATGQHVQFQLGAQWLVKFTACRVIEAKISGVSRSRLLAPGGTHLRPTIGLQL